MDRNDDGGWQPVRRTRWLLRLVRHYLGPGPYLDFGCGTGQLLPGLSAHGSASGFELSESAAEVARTASPGCPVHTALADIPSGVFRGLTAISSLDRLDDDAKYVALSCWRRILVPDGRALVLVRHSDQVPDHQDDTDLHAKPHEQWRSLLADEGFTVLREGGDGSWTAPGGTFSTLLRSVPASVQYAAGRVVLKPGSGESSVFVVERSARA